MARSVLIVGVLPLVCAIALGACGSSGKKNAANSHSDVRIAFSRCMRAHGVTNFPDPGGGGGGGGGINLDGTGINPASPAFRSAQRTCFKLLPGGGPGGGHASAEAIRQDLDTARCMRAHGVPGFPDPIVTSTPPNIDPGKYSEAEFGNGIFIGVPSTINPRSPAFVAAAKACNFG
jgi:hypothetical protein